jgi:hypothetical protein
MAEAAIGAFDDPTGLRLKAADAFVFLTELSILRVTSRADLVAFGRCFGARFFGSRESDHRIGTAFACDGASRRPAMKNVRLACDRTGGSDLSLRGTTRVRVGPKNVVREWARRMSIDRDPAPAGFETARRRRVMGWVLGLGGYGRGGRRGRRGGFRFDRRGFATAREDHDREGAQEREPSHRAQVYQTGRRWGLTPSSTAVMSGG